MGVNNVVEKVSVDVDDLPSVILTELRDTSGPSGDTVTVRVTVPEKPERLVKVITPLADAPAEMVREDEPMDNVKSLTVTVIITKCDREPDTPVTVTVYVPAEPLHDSVDVAEAPRPTLGSVNEQMRSVEETEDPRFTIPVKPFRLLTVIAEVLGELAGMAKETGFA